MEEDKKEEQLNKEEGKELEGCKKQAEEYLNNWKRERADFLNYKKDETKRMEDFLKFSTEGIIIELIDVIDGIEVARNNLPESKELANWIQGFDGSLDKLNGFLKKFGVEKIKVKSDPSTHSTRPQGGTSSEPQSNSEPVESASSGQVKFDPNLHEAVFSESGELMPEGVNLEGNLEEVRPGYTMHGKVIRPARVKIIK